MIHKLNYEALYTLLAQEGRESLVGMDTAHFPLPKDETEKQKVLAAGSAKLAQQEDDGGLKLVQVMAAATAVIHAIFRKEPGPDQNRWYYTNGTEIVRLELESEGVFALSSIPNKAEMLAEIDQFVPLQPAPETLNYRVKIDYDDFLTLRDLASVWEEVPALEILESDGLDQVAARDLFDSAVEPEWRGIIECLTCKDQTVTGKSTIRVLQGAEISWVIQPSTDGKLIVETARQGLFQQTLATIWDASLAG